VVELLNGEVCSKTGLAAFFSHDANAYICCLNHRHIVAAVADAADTLLGIILDELGHFCFLRG
jgi:hypothetical protein